MIVFKSNILTLEVEWMHMDILKLGFRFFVFACALIKVVANNGRARLILHLIR